MLTTSDLIAFVPTLDLARARRFYAETLELRVENESAYACVVDANGTMLRVTPVTTLVSASHTVLGWRVTLTQFADAQPA